jgi:prophage regulatory protein
MSMNNPENLSLDPVLSKAAVANLLGVSPSSIDRWSRAGAFPPKLQLGPARVGWRKTAVEAWLAER